jgi:hypothetical protein
MRTKNPIISFTSIDLISEIDFIQHNSFLKRFIELIYKDHYGSYLTSFVFIFEINSRYFLWKIHLLFCLEAQR